MFHFLILIIALPLWAYEKKEVRETNLPSSPIQVYENKEEPNAQVKNIAPVQQTEEEDSPKTIIIREQPPVQVYSVPLTPQDKLSKARKQAEEETENTIKTRLELLRLKDEKARMEQLLTPLEDEHISTVQQPEKTTPDESAAPSSQRTTRYFLHAGMGHLDHYTRRTPYPQSIQRIGTASSLGLGLYDSHKFSIGYTWIFSKHQIIYPIPGMAPNLFSFNLQSHSITLKYYVLSKHSKLIKPFIGAAASFNIRNYKTLVDELRKYDPNYYDPSYYWHERVSKAFQGALTAGVELLISRYFLIGLDLRFYMNIHDLQDIWLSKDRFYYSQAFQVQMPLPEEMSWYNLQGFIRILL